MSREEDVVIPCELPERIFAFGEELTGVRVTPYHKPTALAEIFNSLDPEEVEVIRLSPFGRLIEIAEKPPFSGRFVRFVISRQLKVAKKHEAWFLFAGKPVRFSLREFAIVTGLSCGRFPKRSKKSGKKRFTEKPYWGDLFGTLTEVPVSSVVRMLQRRTVTDKDVRVKYAFLCLLAAVILPTTHTPRICHAQAEMIKDLDAFLSFPWGRVSFDMVMTSLKERNAVSLSQNTIALKGFVLALQLVMIAAIPALTGVVHEVVDSGSEDEIGEEADDILFDVKMDKKNITPGHARDIDAEGKVNVNSIIGDEENELRTSSDFGWTDDEEDYCVQNLVKLYEERFPFTHSCFRGGVSALDVNRMRLEEKNLAVDRKVRKTKGNISNNIPFGLDTEVVLNRLKHDLGEDMHRLENKLGATEESLRSFQSTMSQDMYQCYQKLNYISQLLVTHVLQREEVEPTRAYTTTSLVNAWTQTDSEIGSISSNAISFADTQGCIDGSGIGFVHASACGQGSDTGLIFPNPSFSLGLTQGQHLPSQVTTCQSINVEEERCNKIPIQRKGEDYMMACRKRKRSKLARKSVVGAYKCDMILLNRLRQGVSDNNNSAGNIDYSAKFSTFLDKITTDLYITTARGGLNCNDIFDIVERSSPISTKVVDALISHISSLFDSLAPTNLKMSSIFLDSQFISLLSQSYTKFSKLLHPETFKFPSNVVDALPRYASFPEASRFYFPFNLDKRYWVAICVDYVSWTLSVLDCNIGMRTDQMMNKEVKPLALMFPYLIKQMGKSIGCREAKPMLIERPRTIPQHNLITDSAVASVLFIQAHAVGGVEVCKCITPDVLNSELERLLVTLYESHVRPL